MAFDRGWLPVGDAGEGYLGNGLRSRDMIDTAVEIAAKLPPATSVEIRLGRTRATTGRGSHVNATAGAIARNSSVPVGAGRLPIGKRVPPPPR